MELDLSSFRDAGGRTGYGGRMIGETGMEQVRQGRKEEARQSGRRRKGEREDARQDGGKEQRVRHTGKAEE